MKNTHESAPAANLDADHEADREKFLYNNDRGFETPVNENTAKEMAEAAFLAIATKIESGHNID